MPEQITMARVTAIDPHGATLAAPTGTVSGALSVSTYSPQVGDTVATMLVRGFTVMLGALGKRDA